MPVKVACVTGNGRAVPLSDIPVVEFRAFRETLLSSEGRIAALFGCTLADKTIRLTAVVAEPRETLHLVSTDVNGAFRSLTPELPQVHLFEREIAEQYGVRPEGHPWFKPVRFHPSYRPGHDAWGRPAAPVPLLGGTDFYRGEGQGVHEAARRAGPPRR